MIVKNLTQKKRKHLKSKENIFVMLKYQKRCLPINTKIDEFQLYVDISIQAFYINKQQKIACYRSHIFLISPE